MNNATDIPPIPVPPSSSLLRTNQSLFMPDGIELIADLYIPPGQPPFPAIVEITPYDAQRLKQLGAIYATRGYLFLAVDTRGRYRSAGDWEPLTHDQNDGHTILRWISSHPLCNGIVGSRGHSYSGYNQLLAAIDAPECLRAMVVGVAPGDPFSNVPFQGGAYDLNDFFWLLSMTGRICTEEPNIEDFSEARFEEETEATHDNRCRAEANSEQAEQDRLFDRALRSRPLQDLDIAFGLRQPVFRKWLQHWQLDDFWQARSVGPHLARTAVPTLHISGWWDGNGRGATSFYYGMRTLAATAHTREQQRLLMGPWDHDLKAPDCRDLLDAEASLLQRAALRTPLNDELAWFDKHLMGLPTGPATGSRVNLFITGVYRWHEFNDWPPTDSKSTPYLLVKKDGRKTGCLGVVLPPGSCCESHYCFDPDEPTPFARPDVDGERIPFDNSPLQDAREDMLLFDTATVESPLTLIGELKLLLYASADVPDFDLCAKLLDLYPDDRAIYLSDGILRARFREGWDRPRPVEPGEILPYLIDLWHIGHVLRSGHALRLEISSGAHLRFDINPCTGGELATETKARVAHITLHHDADHPSALMLPVYGIPLKSGD